jgi:transcriptional regulator with XRE-family HTH domain
MDNWTTNSAEAVKLYLENQNKTQKELAAMIGINQDAVSKRLKRAYFEEIKELDLLYRDKIDTLLK